MGQSQKSPRVKGSEVGPSVEGEVKPDSSSMPKDPDAVASNPPSSSKDQDTPNQLTNIKAEARADKQVSDPWTRFQTICLRCLC